MRILDIFSKSALHAAIALTLMSFALVSCELMEPVRFKKIDIDQAKSKRKSGKQINPIESINEIQVPDQVEIYKGSGAFVDKKEVTAISTRVAGNGKYVLNFENAELTEVIRVILDESLKRTYALDPKVAGKVNLRTSKPLTEEALLSTLEMILQVNNAVLVKRGKTYQILSATSALSSGSVAKVAGTPLSAGYQFRIFPLSFVSAKQMQEILKPLLPPTSLLQIDATRNLLMVSGSAEQLENIEQTVNIFDVNSMQGLSFGLFPLNSVDPETINKELGDIFGYKSGGPMEDMFKIVPIERLNAILVITPQAQYLQQIKQWLSRLDRSKTGSKGSVHVYQAQHLRAVDLAATLNDIFSPASPNQRVRKAPLASGKKPVQATNKADGSAAASYESSSSATSSTSSYDGSSQGQEGRGVAGVGDMRIIADEINNSLIVLASAKDYTTVHSLLVQLDVMPLQVHIDASILSVNLGDDLKYGVEWRFKNPKGKLTGVGMLGDLAIDAAFPGFSYVISKADDVEAILHALSRNEDISVVSSPSLMVLNNQEARIQVGDQVPIRTSESTNTSGSINPIQTSSIEMRDTGVTLKVTPRVNASGLVIMDIDQSVDTPSTTSTSSIDSPTILKRSINSSVAIDSSETVVLGGLISDNYENNSIGIPYLKDIPFVGALFSTTQRKKTRNELIVLITPEVVYNKSDARDVTQEYKSKLTDIYDILPTLKKANAQK